MTSLDMELERDVKKQCLCASSCVSTSPSKGVSYFFLFERFFIMRLSHHSKHFRHWFGNLEFFLIHTNFEVAFSVSIKKCHMNFDRDYNEVANCFVQCGHFNNIKFFNPETQDVFPFICVFFNFFHQWFVVVSVSVFHLFG